jgi:hypothetical protein
LVLVHQPQSCRWWLRSSPVSSKGKKNYKTTTTKKSTTKYPKFKCNIVSVSLSACSCSSAIVSSKEEKKKKKEFWRQFCEYLSEAVAHLPTAISLLLLEALFMQISGVSLTLTWSCRLCLFRVLLGTTATITRFLLSKHTGGGSTTPTFSGQCVYLQFTWKMDLPFLLWSFPPTATFTSFPTPRLPSLASLFI